MRNRFIGRLQQLNDETSEMGILAQNAILNAVQVLKTGDGSLLEASRKYEDEINAKEKDIENLCLKIILHEQPVADDLRVVSATLKIITDMERIGDNALDIAEIAKKLHEKDAPFEPNGITAMAEETLKMVDDSIAAYVNLDMEMVKKVIKADDIVDDLFEKYVIHLSEKFAKAQNNKFPQIELLLIAKYFEKIADHAVNIAEWTEFAVTGNHERGK
jgi:phosphate transport system protein